MPTGWSRVRGRPRLGAALVVVTALLAAATAVSGYVRAEFTDKQEFAARTASALDDEDVRIVVAGQMVDGVAHVSSPDLLTVRPLLVRALGGLLDNQAFRRIVTAAVAARHARLTQGREGVVVTVARAGGQILEVVRALSPRAARALPDDLRPELLRLPPRNFELRVARVLSDLAGLWWPLLAATLAAAAACGLLAGWLRPALMCLGAAAALAGLLVAACVTVAGDIVVDHAAAAIDLDDLHERSALHALWLALFGDLRSTGLVVALGGAAVAVLALGLPFERWLEFGRSRGEVLARSPRPAPRLARAALLAGLGLGLVLAPAAVGRGVAVVVGLMLLLLGLASLGGRAQPAEGQPGTSAPLPRAVALAVAATVAATVVAGLLLLPAPGVDSSGAVAASARGCNGSRALCGRRLDEVVFPATHNSYAASAEPGWYFANQRHGIERQLADGIRGVLVDVHYGVRDTSSGRVRTDLAYEGSSRNKVIRELGPKAVRAAEAAAGRIGARNLAGPRGAYMCHTLCELGAEPLTGQLELVASFLAANRREVVIMFVEPYVGVAAIERGMRDAGLLNQAASLRRDEPLPTLGQLVRRNTRLVVFAEQDGGSRPWYLPGFSFVQDTPYDATSARGLSCRRLRGDPDSPLLLVNHWIASFPPSVTRNGRIGGRELRARLRRCRRERGLVTNLVAVDFYERSGVIEIARRLNAVR
jgi:hypothetical protein